MEELECRARRLGARSEGIGDRKNYQVGCGGWWEEGRKGREEGIWSKEKSERRRCLRGRSGRRKDKEGGRFEGEGKQGSMSRISSVRTSYRRNLLEGKVASENPSSDDAKLGLPSGRQDNFPSEEAERERAIPFTTIRSPSILFFFARFRTTLDQLDSTTRLGLET